MAIERKYDKKMIWPMEMAFLCDDCGEALDWSFDGDWDTRMSIKIERCPVCKHDVKLTCSRCGDELEAYDKEESVTGLEMAVAQCERCQSEDKRDAFEQGRTGRDYEIQTGRVANSDY